MPHIRRPRYKAPYPKRGLLTGHPTISLKNRYYTQLRPEAGFEGEGSSLGSSAGIPGEGGGEGGGEGERIAVGGGRALRDRYLAIEAVHVSSQEMRSFATVSEAIKVMSLLRWREEEEEEEVGGGVVGVRVGVVVGVAIGVAVGIVVGVVGVVVGVVVVIAIVVAAAVVAVVAVSTFCCSNNSVNDDQRIPGQAMWPGKSLNGRNFQKMRDLAKHSGLNNGFLFRYKEVEREVWRGKRRAGVRGEESMEQPVQVEDEDDEDGGEHQEEEESAEEDEIHAPCMKEGAMMERGRGGWEGSSSTRPAGDHARGSRHGMIDGGERREMERAEEAVVSPRIIASDRLATFRTDRAAEPPAGGTAGRGISTARASEGQVGREQEGHGQEGQEEQEEEDRQRLAVAAAAFMEEAAAASDAAEGQLLQHVRQVGSFG